MKKIIVVLILLLVSAISYAEFSYQRGSFNKCKVKIISSDALVNRQQYLEREINTFCNNKEVIDIKFQDNANATVLIIYKDK